MKAIGLSLGVLLLVSVPSIPVQAAGKSAAVQGLAQQRAAQVIKNRNAIITRALRQSGIAYWSESHGTPVAIDYRGQRSSIERIRVSPHGPGRLRGKGAAWRPLHRVSLDFSWGTLKLESR